MGLPGSVPGIPQIGKGFLKILCRVIAAGQILPNFFQRIQQSVQCVQCTACVIQNVCQIVQRLRDPSGKFIDFVNPEILAVSEEEETAYEGCLSFPGHNGAVTRPVAVKVRAQDRNGNWFELEAEDLLARCIQHENDHLDGITIMESSEYFYEDTEEGKKAAREAKGNN